MIQVYTGNGKGKTTAALGLALRAAGAGLKVHIIQFAKGRDYGELAALKKIKNIKLKQCGSRCFITCAPSKKDLAKAQSDLIQAKYDFIFKTTILDFYMGKPISINK